MGEYIACAFSGHFAVVVFYLFINFLCFKMTARASEEGALHNRQICPQARKAAKLSVLSPQITLMWNNSAFCLWCFSSSCLPLLLPYHLCYPELTSQMYWNFTKPIKFHTIFFLSFFSSDIVLHARLSSSPVLLCVSCLCSLAVFWIPKCSEYKLEGEWFLTSWSDQFTFTHILSLLCCLWANSAQIRRTFWLCGMQPFWRHC